MHCLRDADDRNATDEAVVKYRVALLAIALVLVAMSAHARVNVPAKSIMAMGFGNCNQYVDGCKWANNLAGDPDAIAAAERSYYNTIKDGAEIGIDGFAFDATSNPASMAWRIARLSNAMRKYNSENPTTKRCIFPLYEQTGGDPLSMFNAADNNGAADSPLCEIEGKPVVGIWWNNACKNPLPALSSKKPFVVVGTWAWAANNVAPKSCVDTWKSYGAAKVINYSWISGNMNLVNSYKASKAAAENAGSEFMMGIPSARTNQCGAKGTGACANADANYLFRDGKGFEAALRALRAPLVTSGINRMFFTMSHPGDWGEDSSWEGAIVCDANDTVPHNQSINGISSGFTCPNVPSRLRGTIPMNHNYTEYGNKAFTKRGFHRIAMMWSDLWKNGNDQADTAPFVAFAYREHPFGINASTFDVCPNATAKVDGNSLGGASGAGADNLYITSYAAAPIKLRVKVGSTVVGTYTLPARQAMLDTDARQQVIAWGANRGRPTFEVLDAANNVIVSKEGEVEYTNTPRDRANNTARNYSTYADFFDIPTTQSAITASISKGLADRAEGDVGTSDSTFNVTLSGPAPNPVDINWKVTSSQANEQDFFFEEDNGIVDTPQCSNAVPPPQAAAAGVTKLAFCDNFSSDSIARGATAADRTIGGAKKWSTEVGFGNIAGVDPTFKSDGTVDLKITTDQAKWDLSSAIVRNGQSVGYLIDGKRNFYVEARWKLTGTTKVPSFRFQDFCYTYNFGTCANNQAIAFDMWTNLNGYTPANLYTYSPAKKIIGCDQTNSADAVGTNQWATVGHLYTSDPAQQQVYKNDQLLYTRTTSTACTGGSASFIAGVATGRFPLMIGAAVGDTLSLDWYRVWVNPND